MTHRLYAHRSVAELLVTELDLVREDAKSPLTLMLDITPWMASHDLTFSEFDSGFEDVM